MKKSTESEKLNVASAATAAAANHHENCRQRLAAAQQTAKSTEADSHQASEDERALRSLLETRAAEPTAAEVKELKRLAVLAVEARSDAALAAARVLAADTALAQASKELRAAQRTESEVGYHGVSESLAAKILELEPLHSEFCEAFERFQHLGGLDQPSNVAGAFAWARGVLAEAAARVPKQQSSPNPNTAVVMLRSVSVPTFGQFCAGETCGFPPAIAAQLVAQHDAKWLVDGEFPNRNALVRAARGIINNVARMMGRRTTENDALEAGWTSA